MEEKSVLGTTICTQIGIICKDIEETAKAYGEFFDMEYKISSTPAPEIAKTEYLGKPTRAGCKQAFFKIGENIDIELIEPNDEPSTWKHDLEKRGEGIHHIAFFVKDTDGKICKLNELGMPLLQKGGWPGGRYAYIDATKQLKVTLELLENV